MMEEMGAIPDDLDVFRILEISDVHSQMWLQSTPELFDTEALVSPAQIIIFCVHFHVAGDIFGILWWAQEIGVKSLPF